MCFLILELVLIKDLTLMDLKLFLNWSEIVDLIKRSKVQNHYYDCIRILKLLLSL